MRVALIIGNFDGCHRGHLALVERAKAVAGAGGRVVALVFDPHPSTVLRPDAAPARLTHFETRAGYLRGAGVDLVEQLVPTPELLGQSPQAFIAGLTAVHSIAAIVEGPDFRFGRARAGSVGTLRELGPRYGFEVHVVDPVTAVLADHSVVRVSSSLIRWLVARGRVEDAGRLLGRPHAVEATIRPGARRGRTIGVPTANLDAGDLLLPGDGIYAGVGNGPDGTIWPAAISVGTNPTFPDVPRVCEAHLVGYDGPVEQYGWAMRLEFRHWLRDQIAYPSIEPLRARIARDVEVTSRLIAKEA